MTPAPDHYWAVIIGQGVYGLVQWVNKTEVCLGTISFTVPLPAVGVIAVMTIPVLAFIIFVSRRFSRSDYEAVV